MEPDSVVALERIVAESKAIDIAWMNGNLHQYIDQLKRQAIDEYSGSNGTGGPADSG